jgi:hypothetical protein
MGATEAIESETNAIATARQQMRMNNPPAKHQLRVPGKKPQWAGHLKALSVPAAAISSLISSPPQIDDIILSTFACSRSMTGLVPGSGPF